MSNPAKHFSSALYQAMAFLFYSQQFFSGAQAIDYFNWFMAPFVAHDGLSAAETKQLVQGFVFQLNQSNRMGAQSAFTNIGLRLRCPSYLAEEKAVFGGERQSETYSAFEGEARAVYRAVMQVMGGGQANGLPFTFPLITTAITRDLDWGDELWLETIDAARKTGAPYFFNLTTDYLSEKYVHAMCCHLLAEHSGGVWQAGGIASGSNKVVSLNLPQLGIRAKNEGHFFELLDSALEMAKRALLESNSLIALSLNNWNLLPFLKNKTKEGAPYYDFKKRNLTFGIIGLNECLLNLIEEPIYLKHGLGLGKRIIKHISRRVSAFKKQDGLLFNLEQTPAESASHKLASLDRKRFGERAHVQGRKGNYYYTNSTHVPYKQQIDLFDRARVEEQFHEYFTGGVISHFWVGESAPQQLSMLGLVKKLSRTQLAYFTFSPDFSVCRNGHVSRGRLARCGACGLPVVDHVNRVVGYFTRVNNWNPGKQQEFRERHRLRVE
jgi:ribonucleoside-triphosphate reductase